MTNVSLGLKQNSCFKVLNTYFIYKKIYGFGTFQIEAYVFDSDYAKACLELKKSCTVLSFIFGIDIVPYEGHLCKINDVSISSFETLLTDENRKMNYISNFSNYILSFPDNKKECLFKSLDCYQTALAFEGTSFAKEQFLVLFRIFETIIAHFYSGVKKRI